MFLWSLDAGAWKFAWLLEVGAWSFAYRRSPITNLEILGQLATIAPCQSTNFIATNANGTARSWSVPPIGKEPNVRIAVLRNSPRICPPSLPPAAPAPMVRLAAVNRVRVECAGPAGPIRTDPRPECSLVADPRDPVECLGGKVGEGNLHRSPRLD